MNEKISNGKEEMRIWVINKSKSGQKNLQKETLTSLKSFRRIKSKKNAFIVNIIIKLFHKFLIIRKTTSLPNLKIFN